MAALPSLLAKHPTATHTHPLHLLFRRNAGLLMGSVRALRCLLAAAQVSLTDNRFVFADDQLLFSTLFVYMRNASSAQPLLTLDYHHRVFAPLWDISQHPTVDYKPHDWTPSLSKGILTNKLTGGTPFVYHANGKQPLTFLDKTLVPLILQRAQKAPVPALHQPSLPQHPSMAENIAVMTWLRAHTGGLCLALCALLIVCEVLKVGSYHRVKKRNV